MLIGTLFASLIRNNNHMTSGVYIRGAIGPWPQKSTEIPLIFSFDGKIYDKYNGDGQSARLLNFLGF